LSEDDYKKDIIRKMRALNLYKKEYAYTINILAKCLYDYEQMQDTFAKSGGNIVVRHTNKGGSTNATKNPFYAAIETLRSDILAYARELGMTPSSLKRINETEVTAGRKVSPLAALLREVNKA